MEGEPRDGGREVVDTPLNGADDPGRCGAGREMERSHRLVPNYRWAAALLLAVAACGAQAQVAPAAGPESTAPHRPTPVLHPNPQSIFDGLRYAYVNVGSGNLTFQRRDIVAGRAVPIIFARLHDSRIADNADFGPGWRLSLAEDVVFDAKGATYVDSAGADRRFLAGPGGFLPHPPAPDRFGWTLEAMGDTAVVRAPDGTERMFERHKNSARFLLRRIAGSGGATRLSYRAGLLHRVAGSDGEVIKVSRRADGRVASVSDGHGRSVEYRYDEAGRLLDVRDIAGHIWWHEYDDANRLTAALDPSGEALLRASYDQRGRVASLDDGRRHVFEYAPRRTVVEGEDGGRRVFEQDHAGATLAHAAPGGVAWRIGFDHRHRVKSLAYSEAALPPAARARAKALRQGTAARPTWAGTVTFQHDDQDRLIAEDHRPIIDRHREYSYDAAGRLTTIATPRGLVTYSYKPTGSVVVAPPAPAPTFEYHIGPSGRISSTGYGGNLLAVEWNGWGQVAAFRAGSHSAVFTRDAQGRVLAAQRSGFPDVRYHRDALGFVARVEHAGATTLRVGRNPAGSAEAVEWLEPGGVLRRWPASASAVRGVDAPGEGTAPDAGETAPRPMHDKAMQVVFGLPPARPQPNHGAIVFDEDFLVPFALNPTQTHVPGLAEALPLFRAAAAFLSTAKAATQFATTTTPPEYRPLATPDVPAAAVR